MDNTYDKNGSSQAPDIKIEYDGAYPNLCSGHLIVWVDRKKWDFGDHCLSSGGSVSFDESCSEHVDSGKWKINTRPDKFPGNMKSYVISKINSEIRHGCCGGCV